MKVARKWTLGNLVNCVLIDKERHFLMNNIGNTKHLVLGVMKDNVLVFLNTGTYRYIKFVLRWYHSSFISHGITVTDLILHSSLQKSG